MKTRIYAAPEVKGLFPGLLKLSFVSNANCSAYLFFILFNFIYISVYVYLYSDKCMVCDYSKN